MSRSATSPSRIERIASFRSEALGNERDLFVYVPPGYEEEADRRYPVVYAHDGQNAFSPAYNGKSWNLHLACDELISKGLIEPLIVVAVANRGPERNGEFAHSGPFAAKLGYPCLGEKYERFLVREAKPYIDSRYRTRPEAEQTALLGSSRGGLVTYHIGFRHPGTFGKLAILSPYFAQYDDESMTHEPMVNHPSVKQPLRVYIDAGGMEGMTVRIAHVREAVRKLLDLGYESGIDLAYFEEPDASHDEDAWAERARNPLLFFFGDVGRIASVELRGEDEVGVKGARRHLNPTVIHESGFRMTDVAATYRVEPMEAAVVRPDGLVVPAVTGRCTVRYEREGLSASKELLVEPELAERVRVSVRVRVPKGLPPGARMYAPFELRRESPTAFAREVLLPRDAGFVFHISEHSGLLEAEPGSEAPVVRRLRADRDQRLSFEVQGWLARSGL